MYLLSAPVVVANQSWIIYPDSPAEISIEYRVLPRGHIEIRAQRDVQSSLGAFLHLLENVQAIGKWVDGAKSATILARPSYREFIVHTEFHGAFFIKDRSMITASYWQQDIQTGKLTLKVDDVTDAHTVKTENVIMQDVQAIWTLTPKENGNVTIRYISSAHPGGQLPLFLARRKVLKSIIKTFNNLPKILADYQRPYTGIMEPALQKKRSMQ
ncbi:MAG: hypothetical protein B7X54_04395 [Idiomarina sp. 34-48-12]|nr:MAG: hypothetical protein B7X54_04395 [Idiomarina sp. 34-48-12]